MFIAQEFSTVEFINFAKVRPVKTPLRSTKLSAGLDFFVPSNFVPMELQPGDSINIASGIKVKLPDDIALVAFNKSGQALKGLQVGACVIDSDYQGEIHLHVHNIGKSSIVINPGTKLVQFLVIRVPQVVLKEVGETKLYDEVSERGEGAFNSTGLY